MTVPGLLRQLVAAPITLDDVLPRSGPPHAHPLLTAQHNWTFPGRPPVVLPSSAAQIAPLVELTERPIAGLDRALHPRAWRTLLERPSVREILAPPELPQLNEAGFFAADNARAADVSHVLVGVVVSATALKIDSADLSCEPLCGLIELVIVSDSGQPASLWVRGGWHRSTRDALLDLERIAFIAPTDAASIDRRRRGKGAKPKTGAGVRKVAVVVPDYALGAGLAEFRAAVLRIGTLLGLDVSVEAIDPWNKPTLAALENQLRREPPTALLMAFKAGELAPLRAGYEKGTAYGCIIDDLPVDDPVRLLDELRSQLCMLANVGAGLMQIHPTGDQTRRELAGRPPVHKLAPFPFAGRASARKTRGSYGEYLRDPVTGHWWSRDVDKHGAHITDQYGRAQFKLFRHGSTGMTFIGSTDVGGNVIEDKHESVEFIPWSEFGS